uniref:IgLON family member 5 n=1 Tax=Oryzias sinensis TaxID=183150 RepID=A0A8C7ZS66_9TELE
MSLEDKLARSIVFNYTFLLSHLQFCSATAPGAGKIASSGVRGDRCTIQSTTTDINPKFSLLPRSSVHGAEFGHLPDNITVLEGESVTLRCRIDDEVTHKAWLNRSNILFTGTDKWSLDKRVTLVNSHNSDFSIHIDKVQVTDEGPYTCNIQANNQTRIAHVYLIVQVPARIVNISKNVSVNEGENVNLYCLAVGRPEPTVTWKDQKYGLVSEGEFLDITEIKRQQDEEYECITNNGVAPPDQRKVKVTVNYPPMITDTKNMPAHLGKTAILRCEAEAVPPAFFEWFRDDHRPVENDNTLRIKHEDKRSLLMFINVTEKHFGNYTCYARNRLGDSSASMLLFRPGSLQGRGTALHAGMSVSVCAWVSMSAVLLLKV